jgi:predicted metal-dependent HD superfamily phosphohydrolase
MDYTTISQRAEDFVTALYEKNQQDALLYHNLQHTRNVLARAKEIASQYDVADKDLAILYIAVWFHDTGHLFVEPAMHEVKSIELMKTFFTSEATKEEQDDLITSVEKCIWATHVPSNPKTIPEQIIADADTYHLGTKDFKNTNKQIKKEYLLRKLISNHTNWNRRSLEFIEAHQFQTLYCQALLEEGKQKNMERLREKLIKNESDSYRTETAPGKQPGKNKKESKQEVKQSANLLSKGIQTMLRLTSENHFRLSSLADGKANILISVNAIIISVILTVLLRRLEVDTYLIFPTVFFLLFSLLTIVIAIMATRPKISGGNFTKEDILNKKINLLFFGNFHKATLQEYEWGMNEMMKDQAYLYSTLVRDIYFLGVVLGKKYKLLRLAYTIFMIGIIIAVLAFSLAVMLNKGGGASSTAMPL